MGVAGLLCGCVLVLATGLLLPPGSLARLSTGPSPTTPTCHLHDFCTVLVSSAQSEHEDASVLDGREDEGTMTQNAAVAARAPSRQIPCSGAAFGKKLSPLPGTRRGIQFVLADPTGCRPKSPIAKCSPSEDGNESRCFQSNASNVLEVVLLLERGECSFTDKALNAVNHYGATAMIVINSRNVQAGVGGRAHEFMRFNGGRKVMEQLSTFEATMISWEDGQELLAGMNLESNSTRTLTAQLGINLVPHLFDLQYARSIHSKYAADRTCAESSEQCEITDSPKAGESDVLQDSGVPCKRPHHEYLASKEVLGFHKLQLDQFVEYGIQRAFPNGAPWLAPEWLEQSNKADLGQESTPAALRMFRGGDGICICAGGEKLLLNALLSIRHLRLRLGCTLPVEVWHNGAEELVEPFASLLRQLPDVELRDIRAHHELWWKHVSKLAAVWDNNSAVFQQRASLVRHLLFATPEIGASEVPNGFQLKAFAVLYSSFARVLFLDADNTPIMRDPAFLFQTLSVLGRSRDAPLSPFPANQTQTTTQYGAMFWPEFWPLSATSPLPHVFSNAPASQQKQQPHYLHQMESGQLLIDRGACWTALLLNAFVNSGDRAMFFYSQLYGDKDLWQLSWQRTGTPFFLVPKRPALVGHAAADQVTHAALGTFCGSTLLHYAPVCKRPEVVMHSPRLSSSAASTNSRKGESEDPGLQPHQPVLETMMCNYEPTFLHATFAERNSLNDAHVRHWQSGIRCEDEVLDSAPPFSAEHPLFGAWLDHGAGPPHAIPGHSSRSSGKGKRTAASCFVVATKSPHCVGSPQNFGYHFDPVALGCDEQLPSDSKCIVSSLPATLLSEFGHVEQHFSQTASSI